MANDLSTFASNAILNAVFNNTAFAVTTPYISLHTADPGDSGASEVTGGSYARLAGSFGAAAGRAITNDSAILFTSMPAVTVTHLGVWDASTAGNFLFRGTLTASQALNSGDSANLAIGEADFDLTGDFSTFLGNAVLNAIFNNTSLAVTTPYISLHSAAPGTSGASEIAGGTYVRTTVSFGAAASGAIANDAELNITGLPAVTITDTGVWTASTAGDFLFASALTPDLVAGAGATFTAAIGDLDFTVT